MGIFELDLDTTFIEHQCIHYIAVIGSLSPFGFAQYLVSNISKQLSSATMPPVRVKLIPATTETHKDYEAPAMIWRKLKLSLLASLVSIQERASNKSPVNAPIHVLVVTDGWEPSMIRLMKHLASIKTWKSWNKASYSIKSGDESFGETLNIRCRSLSILAEI